MGKERVAIVGVGQTHHQAIIDGSIAGVVRTAAQRALDDAAMTWSGVDAVVIGKAPDFFEGVMMPELFLADALGAVGKPMFRVHTAGSVGGSTAIVASDLIASGLHDRVLTVAFEKQSESEAMWALSVSMPLSCAVTRSQATMKLPVPLMATVGCTFGPLADGLAGSRCWLTWKSSPTFSPA